jgi:hypothetical protein
VHTGSTGTRREEGISLENDKAEVILEMELPKTVKEVQSNLGLFQIICKLIDKYTFITSPLSAVMSLSHP